MSLPLTCSRPTREEEWADRAVCPRAGWRQEGRRGSAEETCRRTTSGRWRPWTPGSSSRRSSPPLSLLAKERAEREREKSCRRTMLSFLFSFAFLLREFFFVGIPTLGVCVGIKERLFFLFFWSAVADGEEAVFDRTPRKGRSAALRSLPPKDKSRSA